MPITIAQVGTLGRRKQEDGWDGLATIFVSGDKSASRGHLKASSGLCTCVHSLHTSRHTKIRRESPPVLGPGVLGTAGSGRVVSRRGLEGEDLGDRINKSTQACEGR